MRNYKRFWVRPVLVERGLVGALFVGQFRQCATYTYLDLSVFSGVISCGEQKYWAVIKVLFAHPDVDGLCSQKGPRRKTFTRKPTHTCLAVERFNTGEPVMVSIDVIYQTVLWAIM